MRATTLIAILLWAVGYASRPGCGNPERVVSTTRSMAFIENRGQWDPRARFMARSGRLTSWLEDRSIFLELTASRSTARFRMEFEGACTPVFEKKGEQKTRYSFLLGNDPATWRSDVRGFAEVTCRGLYPGIDLGFREGKDGLEYDLFLSPGADLSSLVISCKGVQSLSVGEHGDLRMETPLGTVRQPLAVAWCARPDGEKVPVDCAYRILEGNRYGFAVPERLPGLSLVIDPGIVWSTYLGGPGDDNPRRVVLSPTGNVILVGDTSSVGYPVTPIPGTYDSTYNLNTDLQVSVLSPDGATLLYATFLGGDSTDSQPFLDIDAGGILAIAARTFSGNFPRTTTAMHGSFDDVCVVLFNPDATIPPGQQLVFSTFLGDVPGAPGGGADIPLDIRFAGPNLLVSGTTSSLSFPATPNAFDTTYGGAATGS